MKNILRVYKLLFTCSRSYDILGFIKTRPNHKPTRPKLMWACITL